MSTYTGKQHKWAVLASTRINGELLSLLPLIAIITGTIVFNKSTTALRAYAWLNANYTPFEINVWWTFGISTAVYWIGGLIFMALDMWEPLRVKVSRWKLQPGGRVTWADYRKVSWVVARNQVVVALPLTLAIGLFSPLSTKTPLPGAWKTISTFTFCLGVEEVSFFYVHRLFHDPRWYKSVHKLHHTFTAPVALAATYCTVAEHFFSNLAPLVLGIVILKAHWSLMMLFFCSLELGTLSSHSGYNVPGNFAALKHDWHHYSYTENYGPTGILDDVYGTNKVYKAWMQELTSRNAGSATSAREELNAMEAKRAK